MKFKKQILCRSAGYYFLLIKVNSQFADSFISASAKLVNGQFVPTMLYQFGDEDSYVIVLPEMNKTILLSLFSENVNLGSMRIVHSIAIWESRFNYRYRPSDAYQIRNYHKKSYENIPTLELISIKVHDTPSNYCCTINVDVCLNYPLTSDFQVIAFDTTTGATLAETNSTKNKLLNRLKVQNNDFLTRHFSLDIPRRDINFAIYVKVHDDSSQTPFICVPEAAYLENIDTQLRLAASASSVSCYEDWFYRHKVSGQAITAQRKVTFTDEPKFSLIVPLFNTPLNLFNEMVDSVLSQSYKNWELILVNASPDNDELCAAVERIEGQDQRIKVLKLSDNFGISWNTFQGVNVSSGDFISFFDHDDLIEPDLLFEYASAIEDDPSIDLLYCDEDKIDENGHHIMPFFKPDFSIDQLRNNNYVCHMLTVRKSLLNEIGDTPSEYDGAQDHYLTLRVSELTKNIYHVPKILYHWRANPGSTALDASGKTYANEAGFKAVSGNLERLGIKAEVDYYPGRPFTFRVRYACPDSVKITIIIPSHNNVQLLQNCLDSIFNKSTYSNYEVIIVENNSNETDIFEYYSYIQDKYSNFRVIQLDCEGFNFSQIVNYGAKHASGEVLLFLNNDIEVINEDWLQILGGHALREDVGAVGPLLLYPDNTIQHAGLAVTGIGVTQLFKGIPLDAPYATYMNFHDMTRNVSAVTGACLAVKKQVFDKVGGFDEDFAVAFNDVDFCLRLIEEGFVNVYTADASLYHLESASRGSDGVNKIMPKHKSNESKRARFFEELEQFRLRWLKYYVNGDPYYNINLNQYAPAAETFSL